MTNSKSLIRALMPAFIAVGIAATAFAAAIAAPKAKKKVEDDSRSAHEGDESAYTVKEAVRSAWKEYIPAAAIGAGTIGLVLIMDHTDRKANAAIAGTAAAVGAAFNRYKAKLQQLYGCEPHEKVMSALKKEECKDTYLHAPGMIGDTSLDFGSGEKAETIHTFYDPESKRYFDSTFSKVLQAEYHLNRNFVMGMDISLNDFYDFLGLDPTDDGYDRGWFLDDDLYWIDFDHIRGTAEDGSEIYVITPVFPPTTFGE